MRCKMVRDLVLRKTIQTDSTLRRWVTTLLLLAFVARALVPAGYMPDFSAASSGGFKVVICTTMGAMTIALDDNHQPEPDQPGNHHDEPCSMAGSASVALPAIDVLLTSAPEFQVSNFDAPLSVQLPPTRAGPQLGSRGPPQVL